MASNKTEETKAPETETANPMLEAFQAQAKRLAERIPSSTVTLEVGQEITGKVRRIGTYVHPQWGSAPVIQFEPDSVSVVGPIVDAAGESIPKGNAIVFVGIGTVCKALVDVIPGDWLHISRIEDGTSTTGVYANYEFIVMRVGYPGPMPLRELIAAEDRKERRRNQDNEVREFVATHPLTPRTGEEPF